MGIYSQHKVELINYNLKILKFMPFTQKSGFGRGLGRGGGRGRQPDGFGLGPSGECVCPSCGAKTPHQRGVPCYQVKCPKCNSPMTRAQ